MEENQDPIAAFDYDDDQGGGFAGFDDEYDDQGGVFGGFDDDYDVDFALNANHEGKCYVCCKPLITRTEYQAGDQGL